MLGKVTPSRPKDLTQLRSHSDEFDAVFGMTRVKSVKSAVALNTWN